jgi:hypothetical protein
VDGFHGDVPLAEAFGQAIGVAFGPREDHRPRDVRVLEQPQQERVFVFRLHEISGLIDRLGGRGDS